MRQNIIIGVLLVAIVVAVGVFFIKPAMTPSPTTATLPASTTPKSAAQSPQALPEKKPSVGPKVEIISAVASVDSGSLVSTSAYPVITGAANVSRVGVIVYDAIGAGIVGSGNIIVKNGHWSYPISVALKPGVYSIVLFGGAANATSTLIVQNP